jgi:hypothetical protein
MANLGDGLGHKSELGNSAQDAYFSWKLLAERLAVKGDDRYGENAKEVLGAISQREAIKFQILQKLQGPAYNESSANYAQLQIKTGKNDKLAMAEFLTEEVFNKYKNRAILENLIGSDADFSATMAKPETVFTRRPGLAGAVVEAAQAVAAAVGLGGGGGGGGSGGR